MIKSNSEPSENQFCTSTIKPKAKDRKILFREKNRLLKYLDIYKVKHFLFYDVPLVRLSQPAQLFCQINGLIQKK
jgi:hypothetical protein